ncbi:MAG: hypothetical protein GQ582_01685 [Methyloprofundus sp.]|nr:hypothetical protein [Methyloprofundus sp.]
MYQTKLNILAGLILGCAFASSASIAGPLNPDCDVSKAAKSAAINATVGVGGRCSPAEAAADMSKEAVGIEGKPLKGKSDKTAIKATKKILD